MITLEPAPPAGIEAGDPARLAIIVHLGVHVLALGEQEERVRADAEDAVHQMRVAARRLRSGLRTFRPLLDDQWARDLAEELRWLGAGLADLRDAEVQLIRLETDTAALPERLAVADTLTHIRRHLNRDREAAHAAALEALDSERYEGLRARLVAATADPRTTAAAERPAAQALPPLVADAYKTLKKRVKKLDADPTRGPVGADEATDTAWHKARIAAKRARYAAEACQPALGKPADRLTKALHRVTDVLGEHQDAVVAADRALTLAEVPRTAARVTLTLGVLHGTEREAARLARARFAATWAQASDKRLRQWL